MLDAEKHLRKVLEAFPETADHASNVHATLTRHLIANGYKTQTERWVPMPGRSGRLDIYAICPVSGTPVAIEIDARRPRKKSIRKLNHVGDDALRVICLRGVSAPLSGVAGVDAVFCLPVRMMGSERKQSVKLATMGATA